MRPTDEVGRRGWQMKLLLFATLHVRRCQHGKSSLCEIFVRKPCDAAKTKGRVQPHARGSGSGCSKFAGDQVLA